MRNPLTAVLIGLFLCACSSRGIVTAETNVNFDVNSVVLLGVKLENYNFTILPAVTDGKMIYIDRRDNATVWGMPQNGYLVGRVRAERLYGLFRIKREQGWFDSTDSFQWVACGGSPALAFEAKAGTVTYITDILFDEVDKQKAKPVEQNLKPGFYPDFDAARAYVNRQFPRFDDRLVAGDAYLVESGEHCIDFVQ